jgi:hypothetical protein
MTICNKVILLSTGLRTDFCEYGSKISGSVTEVLFPDQLTGSPAQEFCWTKSIFCQLRINWIRFKCYRAYQNFNPNVNYSIIANYKLKYESLSMLWPRQDIDVSKASYICASHKSGTPLTNLDSPSFTYRKSVPSQQITWLLDWLRV